jgi:ribosomal protein S27AE
VPKVGGVASRSKVEAAEHTMQNPQLGKQPPRYTFFLNPYTDARFTKCPKCGGKMAQRKLPIVIHVDDWGPLSLNKTCRFCSHCNLLVAHKDEIETVLAQFFEQQDAMLIGNDYLVIGTLDRRDWKRGVSDKITMEELIGLLHDFKDVVQFKFTGG